MRDYASLFLRLGLALVFLIFSYHKFASPEQAQAEIQLLLDTGRGLAGFLNYFLGVLEMVLALFLLLGWYIKYAAPISVFLIVIIFVSLAYKYGLIFDPALARDIGLIGAGLALWSLEWQKKL